jgi:hypothetical protein
VVYAAACNLGESAVDLIASLVRGDAGEQAVAALRAELSASVDAAAARLGAGLARQLESLARAAPVQLVLGGAQIMRGLTGGR